MAPPFRDISSPGPDFSAPPLRTNRKQFPFRPIASGKSCRPTHYQTLHPPPLRPIVRAPSKECPASHKSPAASDQLRPDFLVHRPSFSARNNKRISDTQLADNEHAARSAQSSLANADMP